MATVWLSYQAKWKPPIIILITLKTRDIVQKLLCSSSISNYISDLRESRDSSVYIWSGLQCTLVPRQILRQRINSWCVQHFIYIRFQIIKEFKTLISKLKTSIWMRLMRLLCLYEQILTSAPRASGTFVPSSVWMLMAATSVLVLLTDTSCLPMDTPAEVSPQSTSAVINSSCFSFVSSQWF